MMSSLLLVHPLIFEAIDGLFGNSIGNTSFVMRLMSLGNFHVFSPKEKGMSGNKVLPFLASHGPIAKEVTAVGGGATERKEKGPASAQYGTNAIEK